MNKTIAQQLKITKFPFIIKDDKGREIYCENSEGFWYKNEYDVSGKEIYSENSDGFSSKREYDANGNQIYFENSNGYWYKNEYDANGNQIYREDSHGKIVGKIVDNRPKTVEITMDEIASKFGISVTNLKIKK